MKKSLISLALFAVSSLALATAPAPQQTTSSAVNGGTISNSISTNASSNGVGSSYSAATSEGMASNRGVVTTAINPVCTGACGTVSGSVKVEGEAASSMSGTAFNMSSGNATGNAAAVGSATSTLNTAAGYTGPGQSTNVHGNIGQNAAAGVTAGPNTGGFANAGNGSNFTAEGIVGSSVCNSTGNCGGGVTTTTVFGSVTDVKGTNSFANSGAMTVDGVVLNQAPTNATANTVVNVGGSFYDPR